MLPKVPWRDTEEKKIWSLTKKNAILLRQTIIIHKIMLSHEIERKGNPSNHSELDLELSEYFGKWDIFID